MCATSKLQNMVLKNKRKGAYQYKWSNKNKRLLEAPEASPHKSILQMCSKIIEMPLTSSACIGREREDTKRHINNLEPSTLAAPNPAAHTSAAHNPTAQQGELLRDSSSALQRGSSALQTHSSARRTPS